MNYLQVSELCQKYFPDLSASQLSGILHGLMANGFTRENGQWQQQLSLFINSNEPFEKEAEKELESLLGQTLDDYQADSFSIDLLIPEDDNLLNQRVKAIGEWAQGYMTGYGLLKMRVELKEDAKEALQDLSDISQIDFEVDDDEESEVAFVTIAEHLKMSAQIIYLASQPEPVKADPKEDPKPQLH